MSRRLSGINPLSYLGVEPYTPPAMLQNARTPTTNDFANLGDFWLVVPPGYTGPESLWLLISLNAGQATWVELYPSSGGAIEFVADTGSANPALGILNVLGDGIRVRTAAGGNTIIISADSDVATSYETDSGTATPSSNVLHIVGGSNINTAAPGSSNTVQVNLDNNVDIPGTLIVDGNTTLESGLQILPFSDGVLQSDASGFISSTAGDNGQVLIGATGSAPAWANITSTGGTITITNNANSINLEGSSGGGNTIVSQFTSSGTWTKNVSTQYIEVHGWNAGGGGASGALGVSNPPGGGSGGSYGYFTFEGPEFCFPASATVTIGVGGIGGSARSLAGAPNPGGNGGATLFDTLTTMAANNSGAVGGPRSGGGAQFGSSPYQAGFLGEYNAEGFVVSDGLNAESSTFTSNLQSNNNPSVDQLFGNGGFGTSFGFQGKSGRSTGTYRIYPSVSGTSVYLPATLYRMPTNGGGGAGCNTIAPAAFSGGSGGSMYSPGLATGSPLVAGGAGGTVAGTQDGGNGADGLSSAAVGVMCGGTGGGGGSCEFTITPAGDGGNGGFPGGGGGGGGAAVTMNSGAGGNGADGLIIVIEYL